MFNKPGVRIMAAYFVMTYFIPMLGNFLFHDDIVSIYKICPLSFFSVFFILGIFACYLVLEKVKVGRLFRPNGIVYFVCKSIGRIYIKNRMHFALFSIVIAFLSLGYGLSSYRYQTMGISQQSHVALILLSMLCINILMFDALASIFFHVGVNSKLSLNKRMQNIVVCVALLLLSNGVVTLFMGLFFCFYCFFPRIFFAIFFIDPSKIHIRYLIGRFFGWVFFSFLVFCVLMSAWLVGNAIKASSSGTTIYQSYQTKAEGLIINANFLENYLYYLIETTSSSYYSYLLTLSGSDSMTDTGFFYTLSYPLNTLLFRVDYFLGGFFSVPKPQVSSVSHLNYFILVIKPRSVREGTSPGLIASFNYVFPFPLSGFFCALYMSFLSRILNVLLPSPQKKIISWCGVFIAVRFLLFLFQSPFDFITIFDDGFISLLMLYGVYIVRVGDRVRYRHEHTQNVSSIASTNTFIST